MPGEIDALTSATLKHVRGGWWGPEFDEFLAETLRPRAGNWILDVGCGAGTAEVSLGQIGLSQVRLFAVDVALDKPRQGVSAVAAHNVQVAFVNADACRLPFKDAAFDLTFSIAVLQHLRDISCVVEEFARLTKSGGRILVIEPDNSARYWYSSPETGSKVFELGARFFAALAQSTGDVTDPAVGPKLSSLFARHGIEPLLVRLFPVSLTRLGAPPASVWEARRTAVRAAVEKAPDEALKRLGADYLKLLDRYAEEATAAGPTFVEIQNTMLFATVGQRPDA